MSRHGSWPPVYSISITALRFTTSSSAAAEVPPCQSYSQQRLEVVITRSVRPLFLFSVSPLDIFIHRSLSSDSPNFNNHRHTLNPLFLGLSGETRHDRLKAMEAFCKILSFAQTNVIVVQLRHVLDRAVSL